jgi:hypothetical protein
VPGGGAEGAGAAGVTVTGEAAPACGMMVGRIAPGAPSGPGLGSGTVGTGVLKATADPQRSMFAKRYSACCLMGK